MAIKWTDGQSLAISAKNPVVVSAAAGSGKTAVLVERIIRKIMNDNMDIDRFLVVTFTEAAASEMKEKITSALYAKLAENPSDKHIQRQLFKIGGAHIETVHGFCLSIIKRYFHLTELPSKFRIADDNEIVPLKDGIFADLLEKWYKKETENELFAELVEQTSSSKSDKGLLDVIHEVFKKSESFPVPRQFQMFALEQLKLCADGEILKSAYGKVLLDRVDGISKAVPQAIAAIHSSTDDVAEKYSQWAASLAGIKVNTGMSYAEIYKAAVEPEFPSKPRADRRNPHYFEMLEVWKYVSVVKDLIDELKGIMYSDSITRADADKTYKLTKMLFDMVNDFEGMYSAEKRRRGIVDFSDLEHFAIKILLAEDGGKTKVAEEVSKDFDEIYVDEYQDTNEIQEKLFELVSRNGNIFCVGDIKQSIYRFRNANPSLFLNKLDVTPECTGADSFGKISLANNFRSRRGVIDAVNCIFDTLMSSQVGDSDYGKGERLEFGATYYPGDDSLAEFDLIINKYGENNGGAKAQAEHIAGRIHKMIEEKIPLTDKETGQLRPARPEDFAIMARNSRNFAIIASALESYGIPAAGQDKADFFGREEIMTMTALLKTIDNPTDEVSLVAAMVCPIFAFTPDELVEIRLCLKKGNFYDAVCAAAKSFLPVANKCKAFLDKLEHFVMLAAKTPSDRLLQRLYDETAYPAIVLAQAGGRARYANLKTLVTLAKNYEDGGFKGIFHFNLFLDSLREHSTAISEKNADASNGAVKIMTFHKSKGLEFPIVFLAYTEATFSAKDLQKRLMCDKELGIAMKVKDFSTLADYSTTMRETMALKTKFDQRSEEMRLLYVAMTRAKERLIVVASAKEKKTGGLSGHEQTVITEKYDPALVRAATSPAEWILMVLQHLPCAENYCKIAGFDFTGYTAEEELWKINILFGTEIGVKATQEKAEKTVLDEGFYAEVKKRLEFKVEQNESALPLKTSVSKIKRETVDISADTAIKFNYNRPVFAYEGTKLSGAEKGTAVHNFMQFADYASLFSKEGIEAEKARLTENKFITPEQAEACDSTVIQRFVKSSLYKRIISSEKVLREKRFAIMLPASEVAAFMGKPEAEGEIFVQGVFDCVFFENGAPVIVDYKTDRVQNGEQLRERYAIQLEVYSRAAEELFGVKPAQKVIYSLTLGEEIVI